MTRHNTTRQRHPDEKGSKSSPAAPGIGQHVSGPPDGGKSHLAAALGFLLVENGWRVLFTRTIDLVQRLHIARREPLEPAIAKLDKYHLLILDDLAYDRGPGRSQRAVRTHHRPLRAALAADHPFGEWGKMFPDRAMTVAVVDRLVHPRHDLRDQCRKLSPPHDCSTSAPPTRGTGPRRCGWGRLLIRAFSRARASRRARGRRTGGILVYSCIISETLPPRNAQKLSV